MPQEMENLWHHDYTSFEKHSSTFCRRHFDFLQWSPKRCGDFSEDLIVVLECHRYVDK
jgi:hypothetical protein